MNEKLIEKKLREGVKQKGGIALKFSSSYFTAMPDRIVLMPGGRTYFTEVKSTGKEATPLQLRNIRMLRGLGFFADVIDNQEDLDKFLKEITK